MSISYFMLFLLGALTIIAIMQVEGWEETKFKAIKTFVRTKSGRLIEKVVMVNQEDYDKMMELKKQGKDPNSILEKYLNLEEGQKLEGWEKKESAPMKVKHCVIHYLNNTVNKYCQFDEWSMIQSMVRTKRCIILNILLPTLVVKWYGSY